MKKLSFLALAAAGLLFGACSSDKDVADNGSAVIDTNGDSYVGIAIQLPNATTPSLTRSNDSYNDGDATEYAVKTGKLLLFKGVSEADAKFLKAYDLINPTTGWNTDGSTYVTATKTAVAKIDKLTLTASEQLFAYVVLNYGGTDLASNPAVNTSFSTWSQTALAAAQTNGTLEGEISTNGLLMTNAPIADKQGGSKDPTGANVTVAVQLDKSKIKSTSDAAEGDPAGCIYVERATAKVTLEVVEDATSIDMEDQDDNTLSMSVSDIAWQIINTEPTFYNARQANVAAWLPYNNPGCTNANSKYRFVSNNLFSPTIPSTTGHTAAYRTYFAQDPQYNLNATLNKPVATDNAANWLGTYKEQKGFRAYVPENTFSTLYQMRRNTTCATVRVKFNGGSDFYTISNDALFYNETNAKNKLASNIAADYYVNKYLNDACTDISANKASNATVTSTLEVALTTTAAGKVTYTVTPQFTVSSSNYTVADITDATLKTNLTDAITTAINDYTLNLYKDGFAYYNIRIKHFGEVETPWSGTGAYVTKPGETTEQIYKVSDTTYGDNYFLGRYGIVRDNWYKLSIDDITKLGSATPPSVQNDNTPDDEIDEEYYISAHVHILPWVIRTQSVSF